MKRIVEAGLLIALAAPTVAVAQSVINGTWKIDVGGLPLDTRTNVWILQGGRFQCKSCTPPIDVKADGSDQPTPGQSYDTISVRILDDHSIREIEKKNGQIDSDEKFTVSPDGNTCTDEFTSWKATMIRVAKGPAGSHAVSGSWRSVKMESVSDAGLLISYKVEGDTLTMSRPTGLGYKAKLDGTVTPYEGDPEKHSVSIRRVGANTFEETDELDRQSTMQPLAAFQQPLRLSGKMGAVKQVTFILATGYDESPFMPSYERAKAKGWKTLRVACGHDVMLDMPEELTTILLNTAPQSAAKF